ncbi:MAG: hypothetical protein K0R36_863 [Chryseobacterium sp.]|jgi:hypothetical protein|nr:hypothetical protein [Chryseobacterium sp.]
MTTKNYPKTIYKYRNWTDEFQKNVLLKNQLYLTSPKYFNDPFDCRIPVDYSSLNTAEKKIEYAKGYINRHKDYFVNEGIDLNTEFHDKLNELEDISEYQKKYENEVLYPNQDKFYGVLSMSSDWSIQLLWAHYADNHRGVCYGFNEEKLRESGLFGKGGPVQYYPLDQFPFIDPNSDDYIEKGFIETHSKSLDWKYEEEYRLTKLFFPKEPLNDDRIKIIPDDYFKDITLGIMIPSSHKEEIIKIAREKNIKIFQAIKKPLSFRIERNEL